MTLLTDAYRNGILDEESWGLDSSTLSDDFWVLEGYYSLGTITDFFDHDYYKISLTEGHSYTVSLTSDSIWYAWNSNISSPFLEFDILNEQGDVQISSDFFSVFTDKLTFDANKTGYYYIDIHGLNFFTPVDYAVTISSVAKEIQYEVWEEVDVISFPKTGDVIIDGMTQGSLWNLQDSAKLKYAIANGFADEVWSDPNSVAQVMSMLMEIIAYYTEIEPDYVGYFSDPIAAATAGAEIVLSIDETSKFTNSDDVWAVGFFPNTAYHYGSAAGDIFINLNSGANTLSSYNKGSAGFSLLLHELGHALGLKHPHDDGGSGRPTFNEIGLLDFDIDYYTVMSYNDDADFDELLYDPATPMVLDVIALQYLYGANQNTNSGDTFYTEFNFSNDYYQTLWDASGTDTIDLAGFEFGWDVRLPYFNVTKLVDVPLGVVEPRQGKNLLGVNESVSWLLGEFENIIGSQGDDQLYGNQLDNVISGEKGKDFIEGGEGNDILTGGSGNDTFFFDSKSGHDVITDYHEGFDRISFEGSSNFPYREEVDALGNRIIIFSEDSKVTITYETEENLGDIYTDALLNNNLSSLSEPTGLVQNDIAGLAKLSDFDSIFFQLGEKVDLGDTGISIFRGLDNKFRLVIDTEIKSIKTLKNSSGSKWVGSIPIGVIEKSSGFEMILFQETKGKTLYKKATVSDEGVVGKKLEKVNPLQLIFEENRYQADLNKDGIIGPISTSGRVDLGDAGLGIYNIHGLGYAIKTLENDGPLIPLSNYKGSAWKSHPPLAVIPELSGFEIIVAHENKKISYFKKFKVAPDGKVSKKFEKVEYLEVFGEELKYGVDLSGDGMVGLLPVGKRADYRLDIHDQVQSSLKMSLLIEQKFGLDWSFVDASVYEINGQGFGIFNETESDYLVPLLNHKGDLLTKLNPIGITASIKNIEGYNLIFEKLTKKGISHVEKFVSVKGVAAKSGVLLSKLELIERELIYLTDFNQDGLLGLTPIGSRVDYGSGYPALYEISDIGYGLLNSPDESYLIPILNSTGKPWKKSEPIAAYKTDQGYRMVTKKNKNGEDSYCEFSLNENAEVQKKVRDFTELELIAIEKDFDIDFNADGAKGFVSSGPRIDSGVGELGIFAIGDFGYGIQIDPSADDLIPLTTGLGSSWDRGLPISVSFDPNGYKVVYEKLTSKKSKFYEVLVNKDGVVSKRSSKIKDSEVIDFELEYNTDIDDNGWIGSFNNELQSENDKSLILSTDV